jgi:hypothetical protein
MSGAPVLECEVGLVRLGLLEKWGDKLPLLSFDGKMDDFCAVSCRLSSRSSTKPRSRMIIAFAV